MRVALSTKVKTDKVKLELITLKSTLKMVRELTQPVLLLLRLMIIGMEELIITSEFPSGITLLIQIEGS